MISVQESALINAPADLVDSVLVNAARFAELWGMLRANVDESWPEVGSSVFIRTVGDGIDLNTRMTVVEREAGVYCKQTLGDASNGTISWRLEPAERGVRLSVSIELELPPVLEPPHLRELIAQGFQARLQDVLQRTKLLSEKMAEDVWPP
jgi:hypothetical protein